ncbi:hypothetical protein [Thalassotalea litorea]
MFESSIAFIGTPIAISVAQQLRASAERFALAVLLGANPQLSNAYGV